MRKDKPKEVPVVVESNAVVYPNTMMVELFNADIANTAMLRPSRLNKFAGSALLIFTVHDIIIEILFEGLLVVFVSNYTRWSNTCSKKCSIAHHH
jgi:hypothetical protein